MDTGNRIFGAKQTVTTILLLFVIPMAVAEGKYLLDVGEVLSDQSGDQFLTDHNDVASIDDCSGSSAPIDASASSLPLETKLYFANPGSNSNQQTFLRFINPNDAATSIEVYGIDDSGDLSQKGPISFMLSANASRQINAQDVENGNLDKGVDGNLCNGHGKWQFRIRSDNPIQVMSLIRTPDGFLTSLNDVVPKLAGDNAVYFANPASNTRQQTFLRIVNPSSSSGEVTISGIDDASVSSSSTVSFSLGSYESKQITSQDLENGNANKGLIGNLDDGAGKWRLIVSSTLDLEVMSLIRTPDGFLTNLSGMVDENVAGDHVIYFGNPASEPVQTSFLRIINTSSESGTVTVSGIDDLGNLAPSGNVMFDLDANASKQMIVKGLEEGDLDKGLFGMLGDGEGLWRLTISSTLSLEVMSLVRTPDGFLTNLSRTAPVADKVSEIYFLNPGSNNNQRSSLRLINDSSLQGSVTISALDDLGAEAPNGELAFNIAADSAMLLTAHDLENGNSELGLVGKLGDGSGKWRLQVTSDVALQVQSLLETPTGFLTNLSQTAEYCTRVKPGWNQSFEANYIDKGGFRAGGSEILHIVSHGGRLYAAAGYWMDGNNIWYGGSDYATGWSQILRLDEPDGQWQIDLDMGPTHLRPEVLKEITFTTDGSGADLNEPVSLLVASTYSPLLGKVAVNIFMRNDQTERWKQSELMSGPLPGGENYSVRGAHVHKDSVTGVDRVFVSVGVQGIFTGVYDPDAPGDILWDPQPEIGPLEIRPLALVEANGSLFFSSGKYIYRRNDGEAATYTIVHDMSDQNVKVASAVGGIRGLTAIPNPNGPGESLIFVWNPNGKSQGHIYRLDPDGSGTFIRHEEAVLGELINSYLPGSDPIYVLAAYNDFISVTDPSTGEAKHLVGFEAVIRGDHPKWETFYKGAMYAIRNESQQYTLTEVNGLSNTEKPALVAPRAYVLSPFDYCGDEQVIYFGGHDANSYRSDHRAWIFSVPLTDALQ